MFGILELEARMRNVWVGSNDSYSDYGEIRQVCSTCQIFTTYMASPRILVVLIGHDMPCKSTCKHFARDYTRPVAWRMCKAYFASNQMKGRSHKFSYYPSATTVISYPIKPRRYAICNASRANSKKATLGTLYASQRGSRLDHFLRVRAPHR